MKIKENAQFETISKLRPKYKKFVLSEDVLMTCRSIKVDNIYENMINDYPSGYGKHMCSILKLLPNRECILHFPSKSIYNDIVFEYVKTNEGVVITLNQLVGKSNILVRTIQYFSFSNNETKVIQETNGINGIDEKLKLQLDEFYLNLFGNNYFTNTITDMIEFILKPIIFIELSGKNVKFIDIKSKSEYGNIFKPLHIKNQTKVDVVYVNSLWNVGTIGLGEFKVRGHFRLQPCGIGRGQIKLIFIDEFVKTHYIRKSTKELVLG
jgi:hypothetical protein